MLVHAHAHAYAGARVRWHRCTCDGCLCALGGGSPTIAIAAGVGGTLAFVLLIAATVMLARVRARRTATPEYGTADPESADLSGPLKGTRVEY